MANPVLEDITPSSSTTDSATLTVTMPTTKTADDLWVCFISCHPAGTLTPPSEFTELQDSAPNSFISGWVGYRKATGSEASTYNWTCSVTASAFVAQIVRVSNWDTTQTPAAQAIQDIGATSGPNPPSYTAWGWGASDNLFLTFLGYADDAETVSAYPSTWTSGANTVASGGANESVGMGSASLLDNSSTTIDPGAWTLSGSEDSLSTIVAIEGAAASAIAPIIHHRRMLGMQ